MQPILLAAVGFAAGFIIGAGLLALAFALMRDRVPAEFALPFGVVVIWGGGLAGSWLALAGH
jgi:hypothetical protein